MRPEECEQILASAVRYLLEGQEYDAAKILISCSLTIHEEEDFGRQYAIGMMRGPRAVVDAFAEGQSALRDSIKHAIEVAMPNDIDLRALLARAELIDIDQNWRAGVLDSVAGKGITNQAAGAKEPRIWQNLRFRSESEVRIAQALDAFGTLFFPNCMARLGGKDARRNREADFLVCLDGRWGILEVDGEPFHPASRTVDDHERDRLFKTHGIRVVEHFDAGECFENPRGVVQKFLAILGKA